MGGGRSIEQTPEEKIKSDEFWDEHKRIMKAGKAVLELKAHPNYEDKHPLLGETKLQFTLRCIAHLVSPPMVDGESNEQECVDIASAILAMHDDIERLWNQSQIKAKI